MLLTPDQIQALTGCRQPSRQLAELHRQGFWRARRAPITGRVILECAHYDAVCAGADREQPAPKLRAVPALRAA